MLIRIDFGKPIPKLNIVSDPEKYLTKELTEELEKFVLTMCLSKEDKLDDRFIQCSQIFREEFLSYLVKKNPVGYLPEDEDLGPEPSKQEMDELAALLDEEDKKGK